jgi:hypothetical protein
MAGSGLWAKVHKWLALLMAIQILFWFASGLFFAAFPIERVRSEHMIAEQPAAPVDLAVAAAGLGRLTAAPAEKVELRSLLGRPVALLTARQARPRLYDLASGRLISPITMAEAVFDCRSRSCRPRARIAGEVDHRQRHRISWRASRLAGRFRRGRARALRRRRYRRGDGARSTLWRVYDFLWGLHIMDWRGHEDFNTPLLIVATALALVMSIAGIVLLPGRLGFTAWCGEAAAGSGTGQLSRGDAQGGLIRRQRVAARRGPGAEEEAGEGGVEDEVGAQAPVEVRHDEEQQHAERGDQHRREAEQRDVGSGRRADRRAQHREHGQARQGQDDPEADIGRVHLLSPRGSINRSSTE